MTAGHLTIKHFGPIKECTIPLNKINVVIGDQSSGKSTIVKLLSFCQWAEKRFIIEGKFNYTIKDMLQKFHRIEDAYFSKESFVEYVSESVKISFTNNRDLKIEEIDPDKYVKSKNIYIPAERNFATTIPNLGRYNESNDNIMNLLYDWNEAKKEFKKSRKLMDMDFSFSYDEKENEDYISFKTEKGKKRIPLTAASSGLQSLTPLIILFDYLSKTFYEKDIPLSVFEKEKMLRSELDTLISMSNKEIDEKLSSQYSVLIEYLKANINALKGTSFSSDFLNYKYSQFIIEEPEQNLYPETQKKLVYYLLKGLNDSDKDHKLFITTHSPFILYALNNCMIGGLVGASMPEDEQEDLQSRPAWINPDLVSVWFLNDGELQSIKDAETKLIGTHSFNRIMNGVMGEYFEMLGYLGNE